MIRFWDRQGNPLPGDAIDAQSAHWIEGVLAVGDRLVSWGPYRAISDGQVSWGPYGAISFWDGQGNPLPGGVPHAHSTWGVIGVLAAGDRLVSWGEDGAIRFWDRHGNPLPGGRRFAHYGRFSVLPVGDGLVSWGEDGAIRFWDRQGNPLPGGVPDAHSSPGGEVHSADISVTMMYAHGTANLADSLGIRLRLGRV